MQSKWAKGVRSKRKRNKRRPDLALVPLAATRKQRADSGSGYGTKYTPEMVDTLCRRIANGELLVAVCNDLRVDRHSVWEWTKRYPEFGEQLREARRCGCAILADEMLIIADDVAGSTDNAAVNAARLQVDVRKWTLSKIIPEVYGDAVALTGKDGRDLPPAVPSNAEARIPKLMAILAVIMPGRTNSELHEMATDMVHRIAGLSGQATYDVEH